MSSALVRSPRLAILIGGWSLIAATVLFAAVFTYLAGAFGYPDVLDLPAGAVLPRLLALGEAGRAVWVVYGLTPLLLIPVAVGVHAATRDAAPRLAHVATITAVLSAIAMAVGLLRWPSLQWQLALAWVDGSVASREVIQAVFNAANSYLGNYIGEFLGELFLNAFFLAASFALARAAGAPRRWVRYAGAIAALVGALAMLRNVTPLVAMIAAVNNVVLPVWMLVLGAVLVAQGRTVR